MDENENVKTEVVTNTENTRTTSVEEKKGYSIASLVLGILSICFFCVWYISIPAAILAIIFGVIGRKQGSKGMATAGLILGIIAGVLVLMYMLFLGAIITAAIGAGVSM